ncbi:hypothetical protein FRB99_008238 [Tulasnella sp. 403]|nr:hypothetical protein FRB99_008238 [Tulasnella sp. 403]
MAIINAVIIGDERPTKPEAVIGGPSHDYMWDIADRCWNKDPGVRPPIETVLVWTQKKKCDAPGNNSDPISSSGSPRKPVTRVLGPQDVLLESPPVGSSTKVETTRDAARPLPPLKDPRPLQEDSAQSSALVATNQGRTATMSTDVTQEKRSLLQPTTSFFGFSTEKVSHWQESETEAVPHFPLPYPGPPLVGPNIVSEGTSYTLSTTLRGQLLSTLAVSGTVATEVSDLEGIPSLNLLSSVVPYKRGGNSDVYRGELPQGQMIAIKVLRSGEITDSEKPDLLAKRLEREMRLWKSLDHKYINRVLGFAFLETGVCLIGPWRANGNALGYLEMNPSADRRRLLLQATEGLAYLHNHDPTIVHTDIKANNVLVDDDGEAKLCDFGLSRLLQDVLPGLTTSDLRQESLRWMAPEQLLREDIYTTESDVYALGCLIIEIISGKVPFVEYNNITNMMLAKVQGKLMNYTGYPELPEDDPLWPLLHACWATEPQLRPPINEVVNQLSRL